MAAIVALFVAVVVAPAAVAAPRPSNGVSTPAGSANATIPLLEGIDVSHWQGAISWSKVAGAGKKFAIIKASEDDDFVDDRYLTNRSGAQAAGIWTGAYHFARPSAAANDAVAEADHFVATVELSRGDLIPALDLESSGGLSVSALQSWVTAWMNRVTSRVGIRPMIYTSPAFWKKYMGDTRALADAGYKTLWIAHWGVSSPTVPASNWGGRGWTFWQYSNCGTVAGISGCVDLDRYHGADLMPQAFSMFRLAATTTGQVKQGSVGTARVSIVRTNFASSVALDVRGLPDGATATFDESPTTQTAASMHIATDAAVTRTGTYPLTITGNGDGLIRTVRMNLVVADGIPPTVVAPTGLFTATSTLGTKTIPFRLVFSASDPSGISSAALQRSANGGTWTSLRLSPSTTRSLVQSMPIRTTYRARARATDRLANTSAYVTGRKFGVLLTQQYAPAVRYSGTWHTQARSTASGGTVKYATSAGASATYTFSGSSVEWVTSTGRDRGSVKIYVDGVYAKTISLYSSTTRVRYVPFARNFGATGVHKLRIVVVGTAHHPRVDVDAFARLVVT